MMRDETRQPPLQPVIPNPPRTIKGMKTGFCQLGRIADIVQIGCRNQQVTIGQRDDMSDSAGLRPDLPHVRPARPQRRQQPLRASHCP